MDINFNGTKQDKLNSRQVNGSQLKLLFVFGSLDQLPQNE